MISSKNLLQEYCQKNQLSMPIYHTTRCEGYKDNEPMWEANVTCVVNAQIFQALGKTKKEAELKAADLMYNSIFKTKTSSTSTSMPNNIAKPTISRQQKIDDITKIAIREYDTIILVDGENCDITFDQLDEHNLVLIFVAKNTTKNIVFQHQFIHKHCYVFISESVGKDAADHYLTFMAGKLSMMDVMKNKQCYVLTKDHYGEFLEKFMPKCKFICSLDEMKKLNLNIIDNKPQ